MRSLTKTYTITEYGGFVRGGSPFGGYQPLPGRTFDALESFLLANRPGNDTDTAELLSLSVRRGIGKTITARNYVGVITMKDGTVIEILPKIHGADVSEAKTKQILLEMLRTLKDVSFKELNGSNLKTARMNLFEIFIAMFAAETATLVKQGLKSSYLPMEANERFFRGKLNVVQNIKHNDVSREKFYVCYDEWSINRPENRLIKATLLLLQKLSGDEHNKRNLSRVLSFFEGVDASVNCVADFSKCASDRSMSHYAKVLSWCRVFLCGNSFTAFSGSEVAVALLFPMEKVFENYIAAILRRLVACDVELRTQDRRYRLFEHFRMQPDIVLVTGGVTVIMDTKWKLLSGSVRNNYGISQSDIYQIYAYGKKYNAEKIVLVYPKATSLQATDFLFGSEDGIRVKIALIDLLQPEKSIAALLEALA